MRRKERPPSRLIKPGGGETRTVVCVARACSSSQSFGSGKSWKDVNRKLKKRGWIKTKLVKGWLCPACCEEVAQMILKHPHDP